MSQDTRSLPPRVVTPAPAEAFPKCSLTATDLLGRVVAARDLEKLRFTAIPATWGRHRLVIELEPALDDSWLAVLQELSVAQCKLTRQEILGNSTRSMPVPRDRLAAAPGFVQVCPR
jgi:hypothetical protein